MLRKMLLCTILAVAGLMISATAVAQMPPPGDFQLSGYLDSTRTVHLEWSAPSTVTVLRYYIYRTYIPVPGAPFDSLPPTLIDSTGASLRAYTDQPGTPDSGGYAYRVIAITMMGAMKSNPLFVDFNAGSLAFHLRATLEDSAHVQLAWDAPAGFTAGYYLLYRGTLSSTGVIPDSSRFERIDSLGATSTSAMDMPPLLGEGGSYAYRLVAVSSTGARLLSNLAFIYVPSSEPPETFRLRAWVDSSGTARLAWDAPAFVSVIKYYIYRTQPSSMEYMPDPASATLIDSTAQLSYADAYTQTHTGIFAYQVWAVIGAGLPIRSNVATVLVGPVPTTPYIRLDAARNDSGYPALHWTPPAGTTFTMYYVYRAPFDPRRMTLVATVPLLIDSTTATTYEDTGASAGNFSYLYQVRGRTAAGQIVQSNGAVVQMHDAIELSGYTDFDGGSIQLHWNTAATVSPSYYLLYRNAITDTAAQINAAGWIRIDSLTATEATDSPAMAAFAFAYRVAGIAGLDTIWSNVSVVPWRHLPVMFMLTARITEENRVALAWNSPVQFIPSKYYVYRVALAANATQVDSTANFVPIDSTTNRWYIDTPPLNATNAFAYMVQARGEAQVASTNRCMLLFRVMEGGPHDRVSIVSTPVREARVGILYTYQAAASSSDSTATFHWALGEHPYGMIVDSVSGLVQWTPAVRGWYEVTVMVHSSGGGMARQEYGIAVAGASGIVTGSVTDSLGTPIRALVQLFKRDAVMSFEYSATTDSTGTYRFNHVDVGSYIARATALRGDYVRQWYFQKNSPVDADPILVADSAVVTVNFILKAREVTVPLFTVSGNVSDTLGAPIPGAVVIFTRAEYLLNSAKNPAPGDHDLDNIRDVLNASPSLGLALSGDARAAFRTTTDSTGAYHLILPRGSYIGLAYAQGFFKLFYNNESDLLSADPLALVADTTQINFTLHALPPVPLGTIAGTVLDTTANVGVPARIVAFGRSGAGPADAFFAESDTAGGYELDNLPPGDYYVLAMPLGRYVPSFYSLTGPTMRWRQATTVSVNGSAIAGIDIMVRPIPVSASGYTYIQGTVSTTAPVGRLQKAAATVGVDGTFVYATDGTGTVTGYAVTDASGSYTISGLAPGSYTVSSDRIDYETPTSTSVSATYDASGAPVPGTVSFSLTSTTGVTDQPAAIPEQYSLSQNYPNPFNPTTQINFTLPQQNHVTLRVFNLLGQEVATLVDRVSPAGTYTVTWNGRTEFGMPAASGVYFYQLKAGNFTAVRKMIMLR